MSLKDLWVIYNGEKSDFDYLESSEDHWCRELYSRIRVTDSAANQMATILTDSRYGVYVNVLFNSYISNIRHLLALNVTEIPLRCMKSCIFMNYGSLAFRRHSPYISFVNNKIMR